MSLSLPLRILYGLPFHPQPPGGTAEPTQLPWELKRAEAWTNLGSKTKKQRHCCRAKLRRSDPRWGAVGTCSETVLSHLGCHSWTLSMVIFFSSLIPIKTITISQHTAHCNLYHLI